MPAFGLETIKNHYNYDDPTNCNYSLVNNRKMLAYIPIIGSIIGVLRLYTILEKTQKFDVSRAPNKHQWIVRSALEICSLGIMLFVADLLITAAREWVTRNDKNARCTIHAKKLENKNKNK